MGPPPLRALQHNTAQQIIFQALDNPDLEENPVCLYDRYGSALFVDRHGFTPITTAVYGDDGDAISVQFSSMRAFKKSREMLEDTSAANSHRNVRLLMPVLTAMNLGICDAVIAFMVAYYSWKWHNTVGFVRLY